MNINQLMKQAKKMQAKMAELQAELEQKTVESSAGGGMVNKGNSKRETGNFIYYYRPRGSQCRGYRNASRPHFSGSE